MRVIVLALLLLTQPMTKAPVGTWRRSNKKIFLGELRVIPGQDYADFQLELSRGPQDYNSGYASGRMIERAGKRSYETTEFGKLCRISFTFSPTQVHIDQVGDWDDCGFGYGVLADGDYALISHNRPKFKKEP
jgi:hypothetical protein